MAQFFQVFAKAPKLFLTQPSGGGGSGHLTNHVVN